MALTTSVVGGSNIQKPTYLPNGLNLDVTETNFPLQQGVPLQRIHTFIVAPAPESTSCIAASAAWPGATTTYTLRTAVQLSGDFTLSTPVTVGGVAGVKLDMERGISITSTGATTASIVLSITGYDYRGVAISHNQSVSSGLNGTINIGVPFDIVTSITSNVNPGVNLSFGTSANSNESVGSWIGLPYMLRSPDYIIKAVWDNVTFTPTQGSTLYCANEWRVTPPVSIGTTVLDTARGVVNLPTSSDGTTKLVFSYYVEGGDPDMERQLAIRNQSALNVLQVQKNTDGEYVWPTYTTYDLVGMQYPGDLVAAQEYAALVAA